LENTDADWERWGQQDPYYGVITDEVFRRKNLNERALIKFFESGEQHVQHVLATCRQQFGSKFFPSTILDFGCGVGRLLPAFANQAGIVVGVDISDSMLIEATQNCERYDVKNVTLAKSDEQLSTLDGMFDLIHSSIVFQHIEPQRGLRLFARLLLHLSPSGVGAIQITYAKMDNEKNWGALPVPPPTTICQLIRNKILALTQRKTLNVVPSNDPDMQMHSYNLSQLLFILQQSGIKHIYTEFTDHGGELGVFLFFQKPAAIP
jgi:SAM-dependent methyltransferase